MKKGRKTHPLLTEVGPNLSYSPDWIWVQKSRIQLYWRVKGRTPPYCAEAQRSYLTDTLLLLQSLFGQLLPFYLHGQTHNVLSADGDELLGLQRRAK